MRRTVNKSTFAGRARKQASQEMMLADLERIASNTSWSLRKRQALIKKIAAKALSLLPVNEPLGTILFNEVARHTCSIAFEAVLLRTQGTTVQVFMSRRSGSDTIVEWRNKLHVPGVILLPWEVGLLPWEEVGANESYEGEDDFSQPAKRLSDKELGGLMTSWKKVGEVIVLSARGTVESKVFLVECSGDPAELGLGQWYDTANLPAETLEPHRLRIIPIALRAYQSLGI